MSDSTTDDKPVHVPGVGKGEEIKQRDGQEPGRHDSEPTGADRPSGGRTARDSTSINPDSTAPIDPDSPEMPPR